MPVQISVVRAPQDSVASRCPAMITKDPGIWRLLLHPVCCLKARAASRCPAMITKGPGIWCLLLHPVCCLKARAASGFGDSVASSLLPVSQWRCSQSKSPALRLPLHQRECIPSFRMFDACPSQCTLQQMPSLGSRPTRDPSNRRCGIRERVFQSPDQQNSRLSTPPPKRCRKKVFSPREPSRAL